MSNRPGHQNKKHAVFIGNIGFETTEAQLRSIFEKCGEIKSLRMAHDQNTKKFRGYAFCEYNDADTALSAARNLSNLELNGRALRVDYADNKDNMKDNKDGQADNNNNSGEKRDDLQDNTAVQTEIAQLMQGLTTSQLFHLMAQMQQLVAASPDVARQLLTENPQFCYAMLHAQFLLGLSEEDVLPMTAEEVSAAREKGNKIQSGIAAYQPPNQRNAASAPASTSMAIAMALPAPETLSTEQMGLLVQRLKEIPVQQLDKLPQATKQKVIGFLEAYKKRSG
eukprot:gene242-326_t